MKKNVRRALAISGLAIAIGTSGVTLASTASANTGRATLRSHQERIVRTRKVEHSSKTESNRRIIFGTVSSVDGSTITMTRATKTFTVNTDSKTKILNKNWKSMNMSDIKSGDKVRVMGTISNTTITAKTVRVITQ